ncbi:uncharacterized protein PODANS_3_11348 [Podospora anserina S mat+]|uniref:Podospora anserina S mat+ genomic DNA chromosome 3, supercontig 3 n=1 Tax=Podospora anserina (strain S / ATCC MYA-4624 / DSM 980 / FGSC 10383) TaxID=515849 RepID=B2ACV1_PODAN|nr:uncharacterized protein PODANS_3_11348 [Podospora anserina S mat+]CAP61266.1 unnamed protein product [Podospora anserina S mat+]CDP27620.1 Putative protein of unknown function [Podospora anserina S mat+]
MPETIIKSANAKKDAINKLTDNGVNTLVATSLIESKFDAQARRRDAMAGQPENKKPRKRYAGVYVDIVDKNRRTVAKGTIRVDWDENKGPHINVSKGNDKFAFIAPSIPKTDTELQINQQKDALTDDVEKNMKKDKNGNPISEAAALGKATARFLHKDFWDVKSVSQTGKRL